MKNNKNNVPIFEGEPLTIEQKQLKALLDEIKKNQLNFIDEANKRIIELSTGLLGLLFAVIAFGKDFPPIYLRSNLSIRWLVIFVVIVLILALLSSVLGVQPHKYSYYENNLTEMRKEMNRAIIHKTRWMRIATWLFFLGALLLAVLISSLLIS